MKTLNNNIKAVMILMIIIIPLLTSCKKFVEVDPPVLQITSTTVFNNNLSASSAMTAVYANIISDRNGIASGPNSLSTLCGLSADELKNYSSIPVFSEYYSNTLNSREDVFFWANIYNKIHLCNTVIEGLAKSTGVSESLKQHLIGEAEFMRAFLHFYLVNLYGDVPLVTTSNYLTNNTISRTPVQLVYKQIIQDLLEAKSKLNNDFVDPLGNITSERTRPNKGAAAAMLARVYLYSGDWKNAEAQSTEVISNTANYSLVQDLNGVFLANSTEAIWQLQPVIPGYNTYDAYDFVLNSIPGNAQTPVALADQLFNSFETGDNRLRDWVGTFNDPNSGLNFYYPFKYKMNNYDPSQSVSEYVMVIRLAEQYLIRAEAEANGAGGGSNAAVNDLNIIRRRAGLSNYVGATDQITLVKTILHEKQVELFTEWGHRWLDLKRTKTVDEVMKIVTPQKGGSWNPDWALFPLPLSDIQDNHNLTQNHGY